MTVREMLNSASDDAIASAILKGAFKKCAYCIYDDTIAYNSDWELSKFKDSQATMKYEHRTILKMEEDE